jgi:hypothetical protein
MKFHTVEQLGPSQSFTREGYLIIQDVPIARIGQQLYHESEVPVKGDSAGKVIIDRDPEDVFADATIASANGKSIAIDHPDVDITPENHRELSVGHLLHPRRGEGVLDHLLIGDLMITDPQAIKAIRDKKITQISLGYDAEYESVQDGFGKQKNILINHIALVKNGRCGPICSIRDTDPSAPENPVQPVEIPEESACQLEFLGRYRKHSGVRKPRDIHVHLYR